MSGALELLASLVSDTGVRWGDLATDWQYNDARAVLEPGEGPRQFWLGRPKGGSKSSDVGAIGLAWLIEQAPQLADGYVVSADFEQSNRLLDRARGFIVRTPSLGEVVKVEANRVLNRRSGARLHALAADVAGSEGLLSPFVVCEELPNWTDTSTARGMWTLVSSSLPKWPGMRLVVIGHAGDPAHWSHRILEHARASSAWLVHEVPGPLPWVHEDALAEQRALLLPSEFARRHLNVWTASEDRLTTRDDVLACVGHSGDLEPDRCRRYVVTLDVGLSNDRSAAVVGHAERRGEKLAVVVDRLAVWAGSRERPVSLEVVEAWVEEACRAYRAPLVFDPFQAAHLTQRLKRRGVRIVEHTFTQASVGRLAVTLYQLLREHLLDLPDDDALVDELAAVRLVERSPGPYRIDHDAGAHDDRAIALAMAAAYLVERGASRPAIAISAAHILVDPDPNWH